MKKSNRLWPRCTRRRRSCGWGLVITEPISGRLSPCETRAVSRRWRSLSTPSRSDAGRGRYRPAVFETMQSAGAKILRSRM